MEPMNGIWASPRVDLWYTKLFCIPDVTSVLISSCESVLGESLVFHQENQGSLCVWFGVRYCSARNAGNRFSSPGEGYVSWDFWSCGRNLGYILDLYWGWIAETPLCSVKSGLLSSYDGKLRNLHLALHNNTDASGSEVGNQASLSSCHRDIGLPIHFQEESGLVTFFKHWTPRASQGVKGCETSSCPDEGGN